MQLSDAIAQYKIDYPYQKIRTKSLPDSISLDDEASCFEQLANLLLPDGIISGLEIAVDGSNNLTVQPGVWQIERLQYSTSTITTFALDAQDPTLSRYDVIYGDAFNTLHLLSGDLSADPVEPVIPDGTLQICAALITPTSVTVNTPPPNDYVDTHSNQTINGIKTFVLSPQVPDGVNPNDAVAFEQLANLLDGTRLNNGIGPTDGSNYGLGGNPLIMNTLLNLDGNTLTFTQGVLFQGDYTAYFNANDRALIDAGYFRKNQWFGPWVSGNTYVEGSVTTQNNILFFTNSTIVNSTVPPYFSLRPSQFSTSLSDANNITNYLNWLSISSSFTPQGDPRLYLEISITTANNTTFPLFSVGTTPFGEDWVGFTIGTDNNSQGGYYGEYKFSTSQIATAGVWYELLPILKSHDVITHSTRTFELHIDVAKNSFGGYEFRGRHKAISGSAVLQDYSIAITNSKTRQFFVSPAISPSNYWAILNGGTDPNTQLPNWKGTDAGPIAVIRGSTIGLGPRISYAFQTAGLDNYLSDVSGTFTGLSKINKAFADATYLTSASLSGYLLKSGGTMTGILNIAADPLLDAQAANKHYVDAAILAKAAYFAAGTFIPAGPNFGDDPGTQFNPWKYGDIVANSITTNVGGATINQTSGSFISTFQYNGTTQSYVTLDGYYRGAGIYSFSGLANGFVSLSASGTTIGRNLGDAVAALKVQQSHLSSTGFIAEFQNQFRDIFTIGVDGSIIQSGLCKSVSTVAIGYNLIPGLKPLANGDVLVGLAINPTFGKSKIATIGTLVPGSGYPAGTFLSNVTGGTGKNAVLQVTISGGAVTGASIIDGGINYTIGDVLNVVVLVGGSPVGSGATYTVASITSYTGLINYSLSVLNGPSLFAASTAAYGALIIPAGATYTGSTNGTIWFDGTNFKTLVGGVVKTFTLV